MSEINAFINAEKKRTENLIVHALSYLGELCVIEARDRPQEVSWIDRSGNLRSSIGYAIAHNGKILRYSDFTQVKQGNDGVKEGKTFAEEIARNELCRTCGSDGKQKCPRIRRTVRKKETAGNDE